MPPLVVIVGWTICGVFAYGGTFAYFQRNWPLLARDQYWMDMIFSLFIGLGGPAGLLPTVVLSQFRHGLKFR